MQNQNKFAFHLLKSRVLTGNCLVAEPYRLSLLTPNEYKDRQDDKEGLANPNEGIKILEKQLQQQRAEFTDKLVATSSNLSEKLGKTTTELMLYKGRFFHLSGLMDIVKLLDIFIDKYPSLPYGINIKTRVGFFKHIYVNDVQFHQNLCQNMGDFVFGSEKEIGECVDELVKVRNEKSHPKIKDPYQLVMPKGIFSERQFRFMQTVCEMQNVQCVREADENFPLTAE